MTLRFLLFLLLSVFENETKMNDKYMSKLSPTFDLWAGIYLVVIGEYQKLIYYQL